MKIITNNQPRPLLGWWDLTDKEKQDFDWLETEEEQFLAIFFRYKGQVYNLEEFVRPCRDGALSDWDGLHATSAFAGVLIKFIPGLDDEVVVGSCYS